MVFCDIMEKNGKECEKMIPMETEKDPAAEKRKDYFVKYHVIADFLSVDLVLQLDEALFHLQTLEERMEYLDAFRFGFGAGARFASNALGNKPPDMDEIQKTWVDIRRYKNEEKSDPQK